MNEKTIIKLVVKRNFNLLFECSNDVCSFRRANVAVKLNVRLFYGFFTNRKREQEHYHLIKNRVLLVVGISFSESFFGDFLVLFWRGE